MKEKKERIYIYMFFLLLLASYIVIIFFLFLPFNDILDRFNLVIAFSFTGVVTGAVAGAVALLVAVEYAGAGVFAFAFAFTFAVAVAEAGAGSFAGEIAKAFTTAFGFIVFATVVGAFGPLTGPFPLALVSALAFLFGYALTFADLIVNVYYLAIVPFSFIFTYLICSQLIFILYKDQFKSIFYYNENLLHLKFSIIQKMSPLWCSAISILIYLSVYINYKAENNLKFSIISIGFFIMPVLILHLPEYLLCLPIWYYQRKQLKKLIQSSHQAKILSYYEKTILFKNEMLFFQLPGLHTVFTDIAKNQQQGIQEVVKKIDHLYRFTFQQKQAQKAIKTLGNDQVTAHSFIHYLLRQGNLHLLQELAKENKLAETYMTLFDKSDAINNQDNDFAILLPISKYSFFRRKHTTKDRPDGLEERLHCVCQEFLKQKDIKFNHEIIESLNMAHKILTAHSLSEFISHCLTFPDLPDSLSYFSSLKNVFSDLSIITQTLKMSYTIERFETKRSIMNDQYQLLIDLSESITHTFYQPFDFIWKTALFHCAKLIQQEIQLIQGTAVLEIDLTNKHFFESSQPTTLYFVISNKGQEYAADISIIIDTDDILLKFLQKDRSEITFIEAQTSQEVLFHITAKQAGEIHLKGKLIYSDKSAKNKEQPFSFKIIVSHAKKKFTPINNPYVAGQALAGKSTHLYQGRQDAFDFLDQHILVNNIQHTIVCHGLRRTGKTSLLYKIWEKGFTDPRLIPVYLDMQGINTEKDLFCDIADKMNDTLLLDDYPQINDFGDFKRYLKKIESDKIIVVLLDEFEELQARVKESLMKQSIFSNLRHLMQHESKLAFIFCGTHQLEEMAADYWSIFFNTALYLKINFLSMEHTIKLITEPVGSQLKYDDLAIQQICKLTNGQPYLTQLICWSIVNDLNNHKKRNFATINDIDHAVDYIIQQGIDHFSQHIWDETTPLEHMILSAISQELINKNFNKIGPEMIYERIANFIGRATKKQCIESLDRLVDMDVLWFKDTKYRYLVNLFRYWVYKKHPLEKVRGEIE